MKATQKYDHGSVEAKWQKVWAQKDLYKTPSSPKNKKYILDMFPYPSGATMHVGHLEGYIGTDVMSRYLRMKGYSVLHPMGWDAFGLPAENYAIKTGIHPDKSTHENIKIFKRQLASSGLSYDWSKEIDTSDPDFYRWTQWLFLLMYKKGLAYKKKAPVNWCPKDETVLANEQVIDGKCERCDTPVIQKELDQWFLKITAYADRLISGLKDIDWPEDVKLQQINWIGKSKGMIIMFKAEDGKVIEVFTTRPDTLNSATFLAVSDNDLYEKYKDTDKKVGKFTGKYAVNPLDGRKLPIWKTNYVAPGYGTGAVMGVPSYDERDMEMAKKYDLDIVSNKPDMKLWELVEKKGWGKKHTTYHLRDWLISRQRYWGPPVPMIYCKDCGWQPVPEKDLPVKLPVDVDFLPHGVSPIATSKTFQKGVICPKCGKSAKREVDTMDTYVDSSWYFIRFADPKNSKEFASSKCIKQWLPVDIYVGGGHVVQHLLFARFFWKVIYDAGLIDKSLPDEPFLKLRAPGWILGPDSRKMSKRWGNVVTPDQIIPKFGADTLRLYEMFMGPFDIVKPWSISGIEGMHRFVSRLWNVFNTGQGNKNTPDKEVNILLHQTIQKVTQDIEKFHYNTAIASLMELVNAIKGKKASLEVLSSLAKLIAPFAPHLAEEVWVEILGNKTSIHTTSWPAFDADLIKKKYLDIVIQVNGKVRSQLQLDALASKNKEEVEKLAKSDEKAAKWLIDKKIKKVIYITGKVINFVV
ncbi:MAG TPA: class I tRNA ligase family protein [Patescibacteria group bacterium]